MQFSHFFWNFLFFFVNFFWNFLKDAEIVKLLEILVFFQHEIGRNFDNFLKMFCEKSRKQIFPERRKTAETNEQQTLSFQSVTNSVYSNQSPTLYKTYKIDVKWKLWEYFHFCYFQFIELGFRDFLNYVYNVNLHTAIYNFVNIKN